MEGDTIEEIKEEWNRRAMVIDIDDELWYNPIRMPYLTELSSARNIVNFPFTIDRNACISIRTLGVK